MFIIAELAGDDSLAAIITHLKNYPQDIIIPTQVITPAELKDNVELVQHNYMLFIQQLRDKGFFIKDLEVLENNEKLWNALIGQTFISPCIACHLYCHLLRVKLALQYKAKILTGERNQHDKQIKINQNIFVLQYFEQLFSSFGFIFERPLIDIIDSNEIRILLKDVPFNTKDKNNYIKCSVKKDPFNINNLNTTEFLNYLNNNLKPIVEDYIHECM